MKTLLTVISLVFGIGMHAQAFENISVLEAQTLIQNNAENDNFVILDVRTPEEYNRDHLENAYTRNFYDSDFKMQIDILNKDFTYLIYCQSGNRSGQAFTIMQTLNFTSVYNMLGGISMWKTNNLPVTTAPPADKNLYQIPPSNAISQLDVQIEGVESNLLSTILLSVTSEDNVNIQQVSDFQFQFTPDEANQGSVTVCVESSLAANHNLSASDIVRAQNIALGLIAAPCPQDLLAADVNESGSVSGADLVEMVNVLIGRSSAFSKSPSMTFMINGENRRCIDMDIQNLQQENLSIQAIKKGDLNCVN